MRVDPKCHGNNKGAPKVFFAGKMGPGVAIAALNARGHVESIVAHAAKALPLLDPRLDFRRSCGGRGGSPCSGFGGLGLCACGSRRRPRGLRERLAPCAVRRQRGGVPRGLGAARRVQDGAQRVAPLIQTVFLRTGATRVSSGTPRHFVSLQPALT